MTDTPRLSKVCKRCGKEKLLRNFAHEVRTRYDAEGKPNGKRNWYSSHCLPCDAERLQERLARRGT